MVPKIEYKKLKRTGYIPAFLLTALLAGAFPVVNMAVRGESFISLDGKPLSILLNANWQMMAMLNILLIVCGACMMYHTEYTDNGMQKIELLPVGQTSLFLGKFLITSIMTAVMLFIEFSVLAGCAIYWFSDSRPGPMILICHLSFSFIMLLPTIMLMLLIAQAFRNMWISLGIGVILVFTFSTLPQEQLFFALCPFSAPYQLLDNISAAGHTELLLGTAAVETLLFTLIEFVCLKIRRNFS